MVNVKNHKEGVTPLPERNVGEISNGRSGKTTTNEHSLYKKKHKRQGELATASTREVSATGSDRIDLEGGDLREEKDARSGYRKMVR